MVFQIDNVPFATGENHYGARSVPGPQTLGRFVPFTASQNAMGDTDVNSILGITEAAPSPRAFPPDRVAGHWEGRDASDTTNAHAGALSDDPEGPFTPWNGSSR